MARSRRLKIAFIFLLLALSFQMAKKASFAARVYGQSMMPTLEENDYILGVRIPHHKGKVGRLLRHLLLTRGSMILVRPPAHLQRLEVKRIDGVYGDLRNWGWGDAYTGSQQIPEDHLFIIGDAVQNIADIKSNTNIPLGPPADSRHYGPCPSTSVVARVFLRFWPLLRINFLWNA